MTKVAAKQIDHKSNNFDFLRLVLASCVIITHSYPLTGLPEADWLTQHTAGNISFSHLGVKGFFIISGYLIFQSLIRSKNLGDYFYKRILRLYPALIVVLLLSAGLGYFVYEGSAPYFSNKSVFTYVPRNLTLFFGQFVIKGIFDSNPYKSVINGSLWTISYEFAMYVMLAILIVFRNNLGIIKCLLSGAFAFLLIGNYFFLPQLSAHTFLMNGGTGFDLAAFFVAGSLTAVMNVNQVPKKHLMFILSLIVIILSLYFNLYNYTKFIALPAAVLFFCLEPLPLISNIGKKLGDLSYGIYIYAFPVQQTLEYYFHLGLVELMVYTFFIAAFLGFLSWHLIEKQALRLKKSKIIAS